MKNSGLLTKREQRKRGRRSKPEYNKTCHSMEKDCELSMYYLS